MLMVEHLQKSSPLIEAEIRRWLYLLWDDWVEYKHEQERRKIVVVPWRYAPRAMIVLVDVANICTCNSGLDQYIGNTNASICTEGCR